MNGRVWATAILAVFVVLVGTWTALTLANGMVQMLAKRGAL